MFEDYRIKINTLGYLPNQVKRVLFEGTEDNSFDIINRKTGDIAFKGSLKPSKQNVFGINSVGDFTELTAEGTYFIRIGEDVSLDFDIKSNLFGKPLKLLFDYFGMQRCGDSPTGYHTPCHLDDGSDHDLMGGWHDAGDVMKWIGATITGIYAMNDLKELGPAWDYHNVILDELKWGNQYFLKMRDVETGQLTHMISGKNYFTNNSLDETSKSRGSSLVSGDNINHFLYSWAWARSYKNFKNIDPEYSEYMLRAAKETYGFCINNYQLKHDFTFLGAVINAGCELYKATQDNTYKCNVFDAAEKILSLQEKEYRGDQCEIKGYFYEDMERVGTPEKLKYQYFTVMGTMSLFRVINLFEHEELADRCRSALKSYIYDYLVPLSKKNEFNLLPYGVSFEEKYSKRQIGELRYRYFAKVTPQGKAPLGININILGEGIILHKGWELFGDPKLKELAWYQLDWVMGQNPFCSSGALEIGKNQHEYFRGSNLHNPPIPGGVMNGIKGSGEDEPVLLDGSWTTSEVWTPNSALLIQFLNEVKVSTRGNEEMLIHPKKYLGINDLKIKSGQLMQFSIVVNGDPSHPVDWYVHGVKGGNDKLGYIDENGLYTAPQSWTFDDENRIIMAVSKTNSKLYARSNIALKTSPLSPKLEYQFVDNGIRLKWNEVEHALCYNVFRRDLREVVYRRISMDITDLSFLDTAVKPGQQYIYKVAGKNSTGFGMASNEVGPLSIEE